MRSTHTALHTGRRKAAGRSGRKGLALIMLSGVLIGGFGLYRFLTSDGPSGSPRAAAFKRRAPSQVLKPPPSSEAHLDQRVGEDWLDPEPAAASPLAPQAAWLIKEPALAAEPKRPAASGRAAQLQLGREESRRATPDSARDPAGAVESSEPSSEFGGRR